MRRVPGGRPSDRRTCRRRGRPGTRSPGTGHPSLLRAHRCASGQPASRRARHRARGACAKRPPVLDAAFLACGFDAALDEIRLVDDRQALGQVGVVREMPVAVADREDRRHQLEPGRRGGRLDFLDVSKVIVRHAVKDLQLVVGVQDPRVSAPFGPIEKRSELAHRPVDLQVRAAIKPALGIGATASSLRPRSHGAMKARTERIHPDRDSRQVFTIPGVHSPRRAAHTLALLRAHDPKTHPLPKLCKAR